MVGKGFLSCVVMYIFGLILVWAWLFTRKWSVAKLPNYPATAAEDMLGKISRTSRFLQQITKLQIGYLYVSFVAMCFWSIWLKASKGNQIQKRSSLDLNIQPIFDPSCIKDPVTCVIKAVMWTERLNVKTSSFIENRPSLPKYKTSSNHMAMWAKLVELHSSRVVSIRQKLFHLNSRAEIAHIPSSRTDNFNLSHENTVHGSVIREAGFSTYIGQLHEAITIPQNAVTPSTRQRKDTSVSSCGVTQSRIQFWWILGQKKLPSWCSPLFFGANTRIKIWVEWILICWRKIDPAFFPSLENTPISPFYSKLFQSREFRHGSHTY